MDPEHPVVNITGERVALGPFGPECAEHVYRWQNDYTVIRNWAWPPTPRSTDRIERFFSDGAPGNPANVIFAIYELACWRLIGYTGLAQIDHVDRVAEFAIMIGEHDARGKGYGTEATRLTLDQAFTAMGLSNVLLTVFEFNRAGIRAYEKAGFKVIGIRHKSKFMGGRLWDTILMEALADEFESPVLATVLVEDQPR